MVDRTHTLFPNGLLRSVENLEVPITIRAARATDASALVELAVRDSAEVPSVPVLVAEADGELRAAVSLHDGAAVADPFRHTAWMIQLLDTRAAQLRGQRPVRRRHFWRHLMPGSVSQPRRGRVLWRRRW